MMRGAVISACGRFRYHLLRRWAEGRTLVLVLWNPSTADELQDDPTARRGIAFARAHGYAGLEIINLFAFRAANPADLRAAGWPVGPENDDYLAQVARGALLGACDVCLGWGAEAHRTARAAAVLQFLRVAQVPLFCLARTASGAPGHPLYLPRTARLQPYA